MTKKSSKCSKRPITKRKTVKRTKRAGVHSHRGTGVKTYDSFADIKV